MTEHPTRTRTTPASPNTDGRNGQGPARQSGGSSPPGNARGDAQAGAGSAPKTTENNTAKSTAKNNAKNTIKNTGKNTSRSAQNRGAKNPPKGSSKNQKRPNRRRAAVIDLGTNNCRLLIAEQTERGGGKHRGAGFRIVDSFSRIVRLGEGLGQSGSLGAEAMERTVAALKICAQKIANSGAREVQAVATEACRRADNGEEFLALVKAETGINLRTISPMQEAQLGISSTLPLLNKRFAHGLIFDVGGGSTEVSFLKFRPGKGFTLQDSISVPIGVVNLAEGHVGREEDVTAAVYETMTDKVAQAFAAFAEEQDIPALQDQGQVQTVGMSGTVTTVKALELGLKSYRRAAVDRTLFEMPNLSAIRDDLLAGGHAGLMANGCIGRDRADLVLPGIAILEGLHRAFGFARLLVLDRGLREGLLHDVFQKKPKRRRPKTGAKPDAEPDAKPDIMPESQSQSQANPQEHRTDAT